MRKGRREAPECPKGCRTSSGARKKMRRLYEFRYIKKKRRLVSQAWICDNCKTVIVD